MSSNITSTVSDQIEYNNTEGKDDSNISCEPPQKKNSPAPGESNGDITGGNQHAFINGTTSLFDKEADKLLTEVGKSNKLGDKTFQGIKKRVKSGCTSAFDCLTMFTEQLDKSHRPSFLETQTFVVSYFGDVLQVEIGKDINKKYTTNQQEVQKPFVTLEDKVTWKEYLNNIPIIDSTTYTKNLQTAMVDTFASSWKKRFAEKAEAEFIRSKTYQTKTESGQQHCTENDQNLRGSNQNTQENNAYSVTSERILDESDALFFNACCLIRFIGTLERDNRPSLGALEKFLEKYHMGRLRK